MEKEGRNQFISHLGGKLFDRYIGYCTHDDASGARLDRAERLRQFEHQLFNIGPALSYDDPTFLSDSRSTTRHNNGLPHHPANQDGTWSDCSPAFLPNITAYGARDLDIYELKTKFLVNGKK